MVGIKGFEGQVKPDAIAIELYEEALKASRFVEIPTNMQMRVSYDGSGNAEYVGYGARELASSDDGWLIQKYTYDGSNRVTLRQSALDSWDNRTGATYA